MSSSRVSALDGWRGISISLVLIGHLLPVGPKAWNLNVAVAGAGMAIFFTLSGCLITSVLLRNPDVSSFLVRRLMRIVPLAWLAAIITLAVSSAPIGAYLPHLFFYANTGPMWLTSHTGHFWSLCVEVQFYVLVALLTLTLGQRALRLLPLLAVAVTVFRIVNDQQMVINTPYRIDEILAGCALALVLHKFKLVQPVRWIWIAPFFALPLLVLSAHPAGGFLNFLRPYISAAMVGSTLFAAPESMTSRLLSSRVLAYLAKISYALYIVHGCLASSWLGTGSTTFVKYAKRPLLFAVTFALAHLSTKYYESFFIELGKRWTRKTAPVTQDEPLVPNAAAEPGEGSHHLADTLGILIVSEHASTRFGGEAALAFHYFRVMRARGLDVRLLTHSRVRDELLKAFPNDADRLIFVADTRTQQWLSRASARLPHRIASFTTGFIARIITQRAQCRIARHLVATEGVRVVHQPMPVSPREPSLLSRLGAPVVIGPMNGNMAYPPGFRPVDGSLVTLLLRAGRAATAMVNFAFPGKRDASLILVANERTRNALPSGLKGRVEVLPENGVDMSLWREDTERGVASGSRAETTRFVYMGRLVDWKAVDLLLHAFHRARDRAPISLTIIGDGPERPALLELSKALGVFAESANTRGGIHFAGWMSQSDCADVLRASDALVLPSLWECGGAVVLEAMACSLPVVATAWGGPLDYLDSTSGILVQPRSREALIDGFVDAMVALSVDPDRRLAMGKAARERVKEGFDWERKVDRVLELYAEAVGRFAAASQDLVNAEK